MHNFVTTVELIVLERSQAKQEECARLKCTQSHAMAYTFEGDPKNKQTNRIGRTVQWQQPTGVKAMETKAEQAGKAMVHREHNKVGGLRQKNRPQF